MKYWEIQCKSKLLDLLVLSMEPRLKAVIAGRAAISAEIFCLTENAAKIAADLSDCVMNSIRSWNEAVMNQSEPTEDQSRTTTVATETWKKLGFITQEDIHRRLVFLDTLASASKVLAKESQRSGSAAAALLEPEGVGSFAGNDNTQPPPSGNASLPKAALGSSKAEASCSLVFQTLTHLVVKLTAEVFQPSKEGVDLHQLFSDVSLSGESKSAEESTGVVGDIPKETVPNAVVLRTCGRAVLHFLSTGPLELASSRNIDVEALQGILALITSPIAKKGTVDARSELDFGIFMSVLSMIASSKALATSLLAFASEKEALDTSEESTTPSTSEQPLENPEDDSSSLATGGSRGLTEELQFLLSTVRDSSHRSLSRVVANILDEGFKKARDCVLLFAQTLSEKASRAFTSLLAALRKQDAYPGDFASRESSASLATSAVPGKVSAKSSVWLTDTLRLALQTSRRLYSDLKMTVNRFIESYEDRRDFVEWSWRSSEETVIVERSVWGGEVFQPSFTTVKVEPWSEPSSAFEMGRNQTVVVRERSRSATLAPSLSTRFLKEREVQLDKSLAKKWSLDFTEGPFRTRKKLERDLLFHKKYSPNRETGRYSPYQIAEEIKQRKELEALRRRAGTVALEEMNISESRTRSSVAEGAQAEAESEKKKKEKKYVRGETRLRRYLNPTDTIVCWYNCSRVTGVDSCKGLLVLTEKSAVVIDNFAFDSSKGIVELTDGLLGIESQQRAGVGQALHGSGASSQRYASRGVSRGHAVRRWDYEDLREVHLRRYLLRPVRKREQKAPSFVALPFLLPFDLSFCCGFLLNSLPIQTYHSSACLNFFLPFFVPLVEC